MEIPIVNKFYLIDTENVSDYHFLSKKVSCEDVVVFCMTRNSKKCDLFTFKHFYELGCMLEFKEFECGTKNALDFQMCCFLTELVISNPSGEYVVVTEDTGFDVAIKYLNSTHGKKISRLSDSMLDSDLLDCLSDTIHNKDGCKVHTTPNNLVSLDSFITSTLSGVGSLKPSGLNKSDVHNRLVQLYGDSGKELYVSKFKSLFV